MSKEISLNFKPHKFQQEILDNLNGVINRIACLCTRRFGKTWLAAYLLGISALLNERAKFFYIAPEKGQARDMAWPVFQEIYEPLVEAGIAKFKGQDLEVWIDPTKQFKGRHSIIKLYGAKEGHAEKMRGNKFKGGVFDEYDDMDSKVYYEIAAPALRDQDGWCMFIGTIKPFGNLKYLIDKYENSARWYVDKVKFSECWKWLPAYNPGLALEPQRVCPDRYNEIMEEYEDKPNEFAREYECDDTAALSDTLIDPRLINSALDKHMPEHIWAESPKVLGVDVARFGDDSCVICKRQGLYCYEVMEYSEVDNMQFADIVAAQIDLWDPDQVFIDGGRGEGVIDRLRQLGFKNIVEVISQGSAINPVRYVNRRAEMYDNTKEWLNNGGALPMDKVLARDLGSPTYSMTNADKMQLEAKKDIKKRTGRSPDRGDALALTFAAPVRKKFKQGFSAAHVVNCSNYDVINKKAKQGAGFRLPWRR
jgi:hypothetical protein